MEKHPFDLVSITCVDQETGALLFKRPMFLSFWGKNRSSYSCKDIHNDYLHRYDIEVHNRFIKQSLLMDKYQTPKVEHLDAWMCCVDQETGALLFKRPMFLSFWGKNRSSYSCKDIHNDYLHRYDIEVHNRFIKQSLLMDKYQTPKVEHLDAWMWIVQLTYWLLYIASEEVEIYVNEWEKYLPEVKRAKENSERKSVAMTRKGAKALFSTFNLTPFKPKSIKNGKGRNKGEKQPKRRSQPPQKKSKIKLKTEKLE